MILAPRRTRVLDGYPVLRWTAVPGVSAYKVSVLKSSGDTWEYPTAVTTTNLSYPPDAPPLVPGIDYKLIVEAGGHSSEEEGMPGLGFSVLTTDELRQVQDTQQQIRHLALPQTSTGVLLAYLYAGQELNAAAIDQLTVLLQTIPTPPVAQLLADLYLKIGLSSQAEDSYLQAVDLSKKAQDTEGQAIAHRALGRIYEARGNATAARQELQLALDNYRQLGDTVMIQRVEQQLAQLLP